ncbi:MAG TPA: FkbM family methyltransferase [Bryobacteraceae bacterium]|jgi:FkbM family methyltransferase|nr:FkbM family methyltransferase [Bryobacteraceae bacterium]
MSLVHCAAALSAQTLAVVDVGANVGDSVILLERHLPGRCKFLCIEPNPEWLPYLKANTAGIPVEIIPCFIGEGQLLAVNSSAPGTAGSKITETGDRSRPLDEICEGRQIDLLKVDTDGFDFPILRSGSRTLSSRKPALFFEWDPLLWKEQGEDPEGVFEWLSTLGYKDCCFFADGGFIYCRTTLGQAEPFRSLVAAAECRRGIDKPYWDVFVASSEACDRAIQQNVAAAQALTSKVPLWTRLQSTYWQEDQNKISRG